MEQSDSRPPEYAITGGRVFLNAEDGLRSGVAIHVKGEWIAAVGDIGLVPSEIPRIDVAGRAIVPGLIDVHTHSEEWHAPLFLANGVITIRDTGCALAPILDRRERWNRSDAATPRLVCCGPLLDGEGSPQPHVKMRWMVQTPEEGRAAVDTLVKAGVDQIKLYAWLDWPSFQAVLERAQRHGKFTVAHMMNLVDARSAVEAGLDEIEHCSGCAEAMYPERGRAGESWKKLFAAVEPARMEPLIDLLLERGTWLAVTRTIWHNVGTEWDPRHWERPELRYAPQPLLDWWRSRNPTQVPREQRLDWIRCLGAMQIFIARLIERGAKIIAGSDAPFVHTMPGFGLHDELQALVDCGMTPSEAIVAATRSAAAALAVDRHVGTIEAGKLADLTIVEGDPTANIQALRKVWRVIRGGKLIDPTALLAQAAEYARTARLGDERRVSEVY